MYSYAVFRLLHEQVRGGPAEARPEHIDAFLASLGRRAAARSVYAQGIRSCFGFLHGRGQIRSNPATGLRVRGARPRPPTRLDTDELVRLLVAAAWREPRRAWTLMLAYGLGARRTELAGLEPGDVSPGEVLLRHCKGGKQRRVELGPLAAVAIEELRPWWNGTVLGGIQPQTITAWAHQAAEDAGLLEKVRGRSAHVLRASFISFLLDQGTPIHVVRDLAGHENISTTNTYAVALDRDRRKAVARLDTRV